MSRVRVVGINGLAFLHVAIQAIHIHADEVRIRAHELVREAGGDIRKAFPGQGQQPADQAEIERLKREIVKLKAENDILKKAAAYFAKESS